MDEFKDVPPQVQYRPPNKSEIEEARNAGEDEDKSTGGQIKDSALRLQDATCPQTGPATENWILRVMWILAYLGLFVVFMIQTIALGRKYGKFPTDVSIEIVSKPNLEFPAVTVCNNNPVRLDLLERIRSYEDLVYLNQYALRSVYQFAETNAATSFEVTDDACDETNNANFVCAKTSLCIPYAWRCNGIDNCGDNSDELTTAECDVIKQTRQDALDSISPVQGICTTGYIQCPDENICATACDKIKECIKNPGYDETAGAGCPVTACGSPLTASSTAATLKSANFDSGTYDDDMDCTWTISAPAGETIQLTFNELEVEGDPGSCVDYLQLFNGDSTSSPGIKAGGKNRICGYYIPEPATVSSTGNKLTINFKSDETTTEKGFSIDYVSVAARKRRNIPESLLLVDEKNMAAELNRNSRAAESDSSRQRRTPTDNSVTTEEPDYSDGGDYVDPEDYAANYENHDEADQFYGLNDYFSLWKASSLPDYSDFRKVAHFPQALIEDIGYHRDDFIVQCTYDGRKCSSSFFKTFQDPYYGNCFSFNSIRDRNLSKPLLVRKSSKTGQEYGLKLTLFVNVATYLGIFAQVQGAMLVIHDPMLSSRVATEGITIPVGQDTFLGIKQSIVARKGGRYGPCVNKWPESLALNEDFQKKWPRYSTSKCLAMCQQITLARKCGCTDTFETEFSTKSSINNAALNYCEMTNKTQSTCKQGVYASYRDGNITCDCPQECYSVSYDQTRSSSPWPTNNYAPYLADKLSKTDSVVLRNYLISMLSDENLDPDLMAEKMQKDFARVEIYYEALNFQKLSESPAYDITDFLSDFGGNIGLWLGWSVLALFEVVQFFYEVVEILIKQ